MARQDQLLRAARTAGVARATTAVAGLALIAVHPDVATAGVALLGCAAAVSARPTRTPGALTRLVRGDGVTIVAQPIADLDTGAVHAYELLARFRTSGPADPVHWFGLADAHGLGAELELACLREALPLLAARPAGTWVSVNLSAHMLGDPRTVAQLDAAGDVAGLIVEVTERSLAGDDADATEAVAQLRRRGVTLAVDDVGAGYSGLRQIMTLRPRYLKLDRALVHGIEGSRERAAMIEALVGYAARTGSRVVAEGVETEAELSAVRALGVRLVQGFAIGMPQPPWSGGRPASQYSA